VNIVKYELTLLFTRDT